MPEAPAEPRATVVVDALAVSPGSSAVVVGGIVAGWATLAPDDRLVLVSEGPLPFEVPDGVEQVLVSTRVPGPLGRLWLRYRGVRAEVRRRGADAVLLGVTTGRLRGIRARRGAVVYDLRHEVRPDQFPWRRRVARRLLYGRTVRSADALVCISARSRDDLVAQYPAAAPKALVAHLGADHVDAWPEVTDAGSAPYALAFGHFANKNTDAVLDAWARFAPAHPGWQLRLIGMGGADRAAAQQRVAELDVADRVTLMPWLDDDAFAACFAGASLVTFPSDFEGFGLPVVEALRRGIPCVVSADPALREIGGGHVVVAEDLGPEPLAAAMAEAVGATVQQREAGRDWSRRFTWTACADVYRSALLGPERDLGTASPR